MIFTELNYETIQDLIESSDYIICNNALSQISLKNILYFATGTSKENIIFHDISELSDDDQGKLHEFVWKHLHNNEKKIVFFDGCCKSYYIS